MHELFEVRCCPLTLEHPFDGVETGTFLVCGHQFTREYLERYVKSQQTDADSDAPSKIRCPVCNKENRNKFMGADDARTLSEQRQAQLTAAEADFTMLKATALQTLLDDVHLTNTEAEQRVNGDFDDDPDGAEELPPPPDF